MEQNSKHDGILVLMIHGSPRARGNTDLLLDRLATGAGETGARLEHVYASRLNLKGCIGCEGCAKEGRCVLDDPMHDIYPLICGAHRIVLASPVYFYGVTAQLKTLIDRCQAFWSRKYLLKDPLPDQLDGIERKGYLVSVAASSGRQVFDGVVLTARIFFDALNVAYGGDLLVRGVDAKGEIRGRVDDLQAAFKMGKELGAGKLR